MNTARRQEPALRGHTIDIPVRFAEWAATLWFFFGSNENLSGKALVKYSILGMLWSYVLDLPAIFALFTLPGGAWIC